MMRDMIHSIVTKINDSLYENKNKDYDRAKDFYVENKSDEELTHIAVYLTQYSKYLEGRRKCDTNKNRKEKLLSDINKLEYQFYQYPFLDKKRLSVEKNKKILSNIGKIREQFYKYGFMEEELTLLGEIRLIVKKEEGLLSNIDKLQDQFYRHEFRKEELILLSEIWLIVNKKEIKSKKQQILSLCNSARRELMLTDSADVSIKESVEFLKKALLEIDNHQRNYNSELKHLASLL